MNVHSSLFCNSIEETLHLNTCSLSYATLLNNSVFKIKLLKVEKQEKKNFKEKVKSINFFLTFYAA